MENYKFSEEYCEQIIKFFGDNNLLFHENTHNRKYKKFIIHEGDSAYEWLWDSIDELIKKNLKNNYYLSLWIIVLRYDIGDYFLPHIDSYNGLDDRCLSGGIELSKIEDFEGGHFVVNNIPRTFQRGNLLTHKVDEIHEITKVTKGTRWSLHFGINNRKESLI